MSKSDYIDHIDKMLIISTLVSFCTVLDRLNIAQRTMVPYYWEVKALSFYAAIKPGTPFFS